MDKAFTSFVNKGGGMHPSEQKKEVRRILKELKKTYPKITSMLCEAVGVPKQYYESVITGKIYDRDCVETFYQTCKFWEHSHMNGYKLLEE